MAKITGEFHIDPTKKVITYTGTQPRINSQALYSFMIDEWAFTDVPRWTIVDGEWVTFNLGDNPTDTKVLKELAKMRAERFIWK